MPEVGQYFVDLVYSVFGEHAIVALAALKIIGINIILSGDNAVVIALACRGLPPRQRMIGIVLGAGAAVILRVIFTVIVQSLFNVRWLLFAGGLLLVWIAVRLLKGEGADESKVASGGSVWEAVKIVAIADIVMSLDNVVAIAGAAKTAPEHLQLWLIMFGLGLSIPLVIAGATLITALLTRYPVLVWAGAALLGWIAGELIFKEPSIQPYVEQLAITLGVSMKAIGYAFEIVGTIVVVALGALIHQRFFARYPFVAWVGWALLGSVIGGLITTEPLLRPYLEGLASNFGVTMSFIARSFAVAGGLIALAISLLSRSGDREEVQRPAE